MSYLEKYAAQIYSKEEVGRGERNQHLRNSFVRQYVSLYFLLSKRKQKVQNQQMLWLEVIRNMFLEIVDLSTCVYLLRIVIKTYETTCMVEKTWARSS